MFNRKLREALTAQGIINQELQALLDAVGASTAIIRFDLQGKVLDANANFVQALGYPAAEELKGAQHRIFCEKSYADSSAYEAFWQSLRNGKPFSGQIRRIRKSGEPIWLEASYNPVRDGAGKVVSFIKFATDVSARVQAAQRNQAFLDAVGRAMAVIEFRPDGTITGANQNFLTCMGYTEASLIGKHHSMLCPAAFAHSVEYEQFWHTLRSGKLFSGRIVRVASDGSER